MTDEFYSLVTDIGAIKQTESIRDSIPFDVAQIALGDSNGEYYEPETSQTALKHEVWRGNIEKCEWEDNKFYCITNVPVKVGGFTVREAGIFDSNNNLLVITKFPLTTKQAPSTGTVKQLTIRIEIELSNRELSNLIINPYISTITKDEFRNKINEINSNIETNYQNINENLNELRDDIQNSYQKLNEKGQNQGYAPLDSSKKIPVEFIPDLKSMLTPFCVNSCVFGANGKSDLMSFNGNIITVKAPFTYTTADNKTYTVQNDLTLDTAPLIDISGNAVNFNIFIKETSGSFSLSAFSNNIYTQYTPPSNPIENDIWFKTIEPLASYIFISGTWAETNSVPIGSFTLSN